MDDFCSLPALVLTPAAADAQHRKKKASDRTAASGLAGLSALGGTANGADVAQLQGLMSRAKAAQNGQGSLGGGASLAELGRTLAVPPIDSRH